MQIRTNRFLILFATVLFLVEFLSPAFLPGTITSYSGLDRTYVSRTFKNPGFQLTLFSEQLTENEEEREYCINVSLPIEFCMSYTYANSDYTSQTGTLSNIHLLTVLPTRPSLFKLNCVFQI